MSLHAHATFYNLVRLSNVIKMWIHSYCPRTLLKVTFLWINSHTGGWEGWGAMGYRFNLVKAYQCSGVWQQESGKGPR